MIADGFEEQWLICCVISSRTALKLMNGDEYLTFKCLSTCSHFFVIVELNNCMIKTYATIQCLATVFNSYSASLF